MADPGGSASDEHEQAPHRLLFLGHGAERTGPPLLLADLLEGLADDGRWRSSVVVARGGELLDRYRRATVRSEAVTWHREPLEPLAALLRRAGAGRLARRLQAAATRRALRDVGPADLVYVNGATPPTAALLRALDPPPHVRVVLHVHELGIGLHRNLDPDDLALLLERADHVIAVSRPVADLLVERHGLLPAEYTRCEGFIEVGTDPGDRSAARRALGIAPDELVVGSVGVPDWRKDPDHLLRAVARLEHRAPAPRVVWIGGDPQGPDGVRATDEAERLGLADRWVHVAHRADVRQLLPAFDVFALPAREDALPLAVLEAAAAGLPIVSFRTGGTADLCDAGAGCAVPYPDTAAFAAELDRYLGDPALRRSTGERGRAIVAERHDTGVGVARIADVLASVSRGS